jgi:adenylate cyclase
METEIERKFLVTGDGWQSATPTYYCQGYLNHDKHRTVRVRVAGEHGFLTVKGLATGASRAEFEYAIPLNDAKALLALCEGPLVEKLRHIIEYAGLRWEIDAFLGDNAGLVVAEIELESEAQAITLPKWVVAEITGDARYYNSNLATVPYTHWTRR